MVAHDMTDTAAIVKAPLSWQHIEMLVDRLVAQLPAHYDAMLVVTRGGMVPGCLISEKTDMRNILVAAVVSYTGIGQTLEHPIFLQFPPDTLLAGKRIVIVDDVWDSGRTIMAVKDRLRAVNCEAEVAVLHYKPTKSRFPDRPDYYAEITDAWIVYPWDPTKDDASASS
ncbi:MAG: phosphoribosyltransferase family protein [Chloroflexota bacterium]